MSGRRWFETPPPAPAGRPPEEGQATGKDLWLRCPGCSAILYRPDLPTTHHCCAECGHHLPIDPLERIRLIVDEGSWEPHPDDLVPRDPLGFVDSRPYTLRLEQARARTGRRDAFVAGRAKVGGIPLELGTFDFRFMGGSMGSVVGEHITRLFERALARPCPALVIAASGGARMQEGALSLMQMAKTCAALGRLRDEAGMPYVALLTHPTTGGVAASFAMLGDVVLAEPGALIGFAGPRVIEQTIGETLPEGFQTSEYLLEHGMLDRIVPRAELRETVRRVLAWFVGEP